MRTLLICRDSPLDRSYGGGLRTNDIWQALGTLGPVSALVLEPAAETALDTPRSPHEFARLRVRKPALPWATRATTAIRRLVRETAASAQFDLVVVRHLRLAMLVEGCFDAPVVADCDDLDMTASSIGKAPAHRLLDAARHSARRWVMRRALQRVGHVWYSNPRDMQRFPTRSGSMVPNVVRPPVTLLPRDRAQPARLLMVGKFGYEPNAEGADYFVRKVLPPLRMAQPGTTLRLVGQCPPALAARWRAVPGVEVAGFVDDLAVEYAQAAAVVAPVFSGGGTQIKVLEALGHGCGTVVSAFAARGFAPQVRHREHALIADGAAAWVAACSELIADPALAERLGHAGRQVIVKHYSYDSLAGEVAATAARLVRTRP
jgi:Glycosyl transferases group 1